MNCGLPESAVQQIRSVLARFPQVDRAILYGSRAKGTFRNGSDIDLMLQGPAELDLGVVYRIHEDLDELLLPYTFDLAILGEICDSDVLDHVRRVGVTFFQKEPQE
jgi:predicted nucleotidyltransferase